MRNISQFAVSLMLLASQAYIPGFGDAAAAVSFTNGTVGAYEVKLNTKTASAIEIVVDKPDYEAEVLAPLRAAQAEVARREAEAEAKAVAEAAAKAAASAQAQAAQRAVAVAATVTGSHSDWMREAGIAESDFGYVDYIITQESGWGVTKSNYAGSGAYGLGQALPASKMAAFGDDYLTNPVTQLKWANAYAMGRYGSWANAYAYWLSHHHW